METLNTKRTHVDSVAVVITRARSCTSSVKREYITKS